MRSLFVALTCLLFVSACSGASQRDASGSNDTSAPQGKDALIVQRYCKGPPRNITALENDAGTIGGYAMSNAVMDSPVNYLDTRGERIGTFHVLGSPQMSEDVPGTIDKLNRDFPKRRPVECGGRSR